MRFLFDEYGGVVINGIVAAILTLLFFNTLYPQASSSFSSSIESLVAPKSVTLSDQLYSPTLVVNSCVILKGTSFDYHNYCSAYSYTGKNLNDAIQVVKGSVDTSVPGKYELTLRVTDQSVSTYRRGVFLVEG